MSSVSMSIEFDRPDRTYAPGEEVRGMVDIRTDQECTCTGLTVRAQWRTHGRGNQDTGALPTTRVTSAKVLKPDIVYRYPFRFEAPRGPATYHGHCLSVDWYLEAKAVIQERGRLFTRRLEQEAGFLLRPAETPLHVRPWTAASPILSNPWPIAMVGALVLCGAWLATLSTTLPGSPWRSVFPVLAVLWGGLHAALLWPELKLGPVHVELVPHGSDIQCRVRFRPRFPVKCGVIAELKVEEFCVSGTDSPPESHLLAGTEAHTHCLFTARAATSYPQRLQAGQDYRVELLLRPTGDLPASFQAAHNRITWTVAVEVIVRRRFNWFCRVPVTVSC